MNVVLAAILLTRRPDQQLSGGPRLHVEGHTGLGTPMNAVGITKLEHLVPQDARVAIAYLRDRSRTTTEVAVPKMRSLRIPAPPAPPTPPEPPAKPANAAPQPPRPPRPPVPA